MWYSNHAAFLFYFILFYVILHIDIDRYNVDKVGSGEVCMLG